MQKPDRLFKRTPSMEEMDSVKERQSKLLSRHRDTPLLERCHRVWDNLLEFRQMRARSLRFCYGDQWGDIITVNGKQMTYRKYLMEKGNVVLQTNQIKNRVDTIAGVLVKEKQEPVCHAIDREEQQYGEVLTAALQANCDKNVITQLYIHWMKEQCLGGMPISYESYDSHTGPSGRLDSWTSYINPNTFFYEGEAVDPRNWDVDLVGRFYYGSKEDICAQFARSPQDYDILKSIYPNQFSALREERSRTMEERYEDGDLVFMDSSDPTRCYVCEVWTKETKPRIRLWDTNAGQEMIIDASDSASRKYIREENRRRRTLALASGFSEDEIPYIVGDGYGRNDEERSGFFMDTYWYCRFLAPDGTILWEGESPYADRLHPFVFNPFPYIDGKICGYMNDAIDHNIAINRAIILHDWLLRTQAKGVTVVPEAIIPEGMDYKQFANSWTSLDGMVFIDLKPGQEGLMPQVFHGAAQTFDVANLVATYSKLMDNGTPVNGALQGKTPSSGTSGTLYAQMANNASTPIAALMESFNKFIEAVLIKKMKNIAQFYDAGRFQSIAGQVDSILDQSSMNLNEIKDIEFDLKIKESSNTPVFRAVINQDAKEFLMAGLISFEEYLTIADVPYADRILQGRQARQAEVEEAQQKGAIPTGTVPKAGASPVDALFQEQQQPPAPRVQAPRIPAVA